MAYRGLPKKPTKLRLLHGDQPCRINKDEPQPADGSPVCPPEIAPDVRAVWDYTLGHLDAMGMASGADRDALICYCEAVVAHRKASALLARSPVLIQGHRGVLVRNPAVAMQRDASNVIRAFAHEFGLTPSARSEIRMGGATANAAPAARYLNA